MQRTMKGRRALRRRQSGGYSLMELMVVVMLVAILAALAAPSMSEARNDRICFDFARQYQQVIQRARARAAGTGSAHLALIGRGGNNRGYVRIYQALDGQPAPGPNPVSSCKGLNQWGDAATDPIVFSSPTERFIDVADMNGDGVNATMGLRADLTTSGVNAANTIGPGDFVALCITPSGVTYAGGDASAQGAVGAMRTAPPFTGTIEIDIQRHAGNGTAIGLKRRVLITGGAAPRIKSE
jgi:prepilin-type N-terminal cleavage/methylation domain-containing protein